MATKIIFPIKLNEVSDNVANLHLVLSVLLPTLGFPDFKIPEEERLARQALASTVEGVMLLREKWNLHQQPTTVETHPELMAPNPDVLVDVELAERINQEMEKFYIVQGRVTLPDGHGLEGHQVTLSEYDLEGSLDLQKTITNADGAFLFIYDFSKELKRGDGKTQPDLWLQVTAPDGTMPFVDNIFWIVDDVETSVPRLADSSRAPIVLMNVTRHVTVRIVVAAKVEPQLTEFERLANALRPLVRDKHFADLLEDETNFQISFLSKESGIPKAKIEALKSSFTEERNTQLPAWAFFGLSQLPLRESQWNDSSLEEFIELLKPLEPHGENTDFKTLAGKLREHALTHTQEQNIRKKTDQLLAASGPVLQSLFDRPEKMQDFFKEYAAHTDTIPKFWDKMKVDARFKTKVPEIQLTLQLTQLTLNNAGLVAQLKRKGIQETKALIHLPEQEWIDMIKVHPEGIPAHIAIDPDLSDEENLKTRAAIYANELQTVVEIAFPTEVIKTKMGSAGFNQFLDHYPDFDFTQHPVERLLHDASEASWSGIDNREAVKQELRQTQRLYNLTASVKDAMALASHGFSSAFDIANIPLIDFETRMKKVMPAEQAGAIQSKAVAIAEANAMILAQLRDAGNKSAPAAIGKPAEVQTVLPQWSNLFGEITTCECEHCRSVYSPAAYYVDLLHILLGQENGKARLELFRRRPDLKYTKLSCEHTDTLIPYIDLVNEILETYVAQQHIGDDQADIHAANATNDTSLFNEFELAANPQHPNTLSLAAANNAYQLLSEALYPLNLPFDLNLETARHFLTTQNTSRLALMQTFGDANADATIAEGLGLSAFEYNILTGIHHAQQPDESQIILDLFGTIEDLSQAKLFLDSTDINYTDLVALVNSVFLNPEGKIGLGLKTPANLQGQEKDSWNIAHSCDLSVTFLFEGQANLLELIEQSNWSPGSIAFISDSNLLKFNRFIRLWKKLDCSISELDALLMAINSSTNAAFTPTLLNDLSALWQFGLVHGIEPDQTALLLGNIPVRGENSLYSKLFLNKAILQLDDAFVLNKEKSELSVTTLSIGLHLPALCAALQISEQELADLLDLVQLNSNVDKLNAGNISAIYRLMLLAKLNRFTVHELVLLKPFAPKMACKNITELIQLQSFLDTFKAYDLKPVSIAYLFGTVVEAGSTIVPKEEVMKKFAADIKEGLLKIKATLNVEPSAIDTQFLKTQLGPFFPSEETTDNFIAVLDGSIHGAGPQDPDETKPLPGFKADEIILLEQPPFQKEYKTGFANFLSSADINQISAAITPQQRYALFWKHIQNEVEEILCSTFVQQHLISHFQADAQTVKLLLNRIGSTLLTLDTAVNTDACYAVYVQLFKLYWLVNKFNLSSAELSHFQNNKGDFDDFDWNDFSPSQLQSWLRVGAYCNLRDGMPKSGHSLIEVFNAVPDLTKIAKAIVDVTGFNQENVEEFIRNRPAAEFRNEKALVQLQQQEFISRKTGISYATLASWSKAVIDPAIVQDIKRSLKAKYDADSWVDVSTQVHNTLRNHQRDALVGYLLQTDAIKNIKNNAPDSKRNIRTSNDLYAYFLIDVEMDAIMKTSRLKQAIASVQLFVQRCIMNLESTISPLLIDQQQWSWMKYYREWEANRKVFLYPENWIEPELRDGKSPFFKELESELLQGEVTPESVEKAIQNYLYKLDDVARLDICGIYEDQEGGELHVFGRTFNNPPIYYYRKLNVDTREWTAWEKVQLDIQGNEEGANPGVHLIPVVWNRRLYLFWPLFREMSDKDRIAKDKEDFRLAHQDWKNYDSERKRILDKWDSIIAAWKERVKDVPPWVDNNTKMEPQQDGTYYLDGGYYVKNSGLLGGYLWDHDEQRPTQPPLKEEPTMSDNQWPFWEIKLAWSEYSQNHWSPKKVSSSNLGTNVIITINSSLQYLIGNQGSDLFRFVPNKIGGALAINALFGNNENYIQLGKFILDGGKEIVRTEYFGSEIEVQNIRNDEESNIFQGFGSNATNSKKFDLNISGEPINLFRKNLSPYKVLLSNFSEVNIRPEELDSKWLCKLFYQDGDRNYFAAPRGDLYSKAAQGLRDSFTMTLESGKVGQMAQVSLTDSKPKTRQVIQMNHEELEVLSTSVYNSSEKSLVFKIGNPPGKAIDQLPVRKQSLTGLISKQYLMPKSPANTITKLDFKPFFHPYVGEFIKSLNHAGIDGLLTLGNQLKNDWFRSRIVPLQFSNLFETTYQPNLSKIWKPFPGEDVDFSVTGAYSLYNWELFFHVPMLLANRLSHNQKFEDAMRWYHFVFDPTTHDPETAARRYWQVVPLRNTPKETLEALLQQLKNPQGDPGRWELEEAIKRWRKEPFNPHMIARLRMVAYQKNVLMKYLDNLIAWADNLFRQDTIENINQATQLYIIAAELLGPRPEKIPTRGKVKASNYQELEKAGLNAFSNAQVLMETIVPFFNLQEVQTNTSGSTIAISTTVAADYFGLPDNPKLLGYWDTVADRLFKIRHSLNIEGVERTLALYEPPIDPALLVQAFAKGIDIESILSDLNAPMPYYRFNYIVQKALEICIELKSLGNSLLSAFEKKDNEALSLMRTQHETTMLGLMKSVKQLQIKESQRSREGLEKTKEVTEHRFEYYKGLFEAGLNDSEKDFESNSKTSLIFSLASQLSEMGAGLAAPFPDQSVGTNGISLTTNSRISGGAKLSKALSAFGRVFNMGASMFSYMANMAQTKAGHERRAEEWKQQQELAQKELLQIQKQIDAATLREQIAEKDLSNHEQQIDNARQVEDYLRNKYTQEELYGWMIGEISTVYFQCYQLVYDLAKKAEKTYRHELGIETSNFVQFGVWDSFRKGLLSGEKLYLSLKQMEKAYMDQNRREYEITKHISLIQLDPLALLKLRETGICDFEIPEVLYDIDHPGHYFRRIKSVSISIPCIAGPFTSVSSKLSLLKSSYRKNTGKVAEYVNAFGALQSISTSHGQNDNGMFELNFRDERYLPFEYSGAISSWRLELPTELKQFDYYTISDVIFHVKYTAREGGSALKEVANETIKDQLNISKNRLSQIGLQLAINVKHDLPKEWQLLVKNGEIDLTIDQSRLPYMVQFLNPEINDVVFIAILKNDNLSPTFKVAGSDLSLKKNPQLQLHVSTKTTDIELNKSFKLIISNDDIQNLTALLMVASYTIT